MNLSPKYPKLFYLGCYTSSSVTAENLDIRDESFSDEIFQSLQGFWISRTLLVPFGHFFEGSDVIRNLSFKLI